ncbi:MAG: 16S rRNA (uracil(1498)-N(3))-methyltransferase [Chlorobiaceae bacterium]|nr:16S rRNA (uracil(1498)-N(3))-methyltransferase [Chlorobiaceae bacterium]
MELFYTLTENIDLAAKSLLVDGDEFHHLVRVLRKKTGEMILVTDGNGLRCEVRISDIGKKSFNGEIIRCSRADRPKTSVTVALSLLKAPQRFELFLEKATELGVSSIIPMITARTLSQPSSERVQGKLNRWRTIMLSAARQSKRYYLPELTEPLSFKKVMLLQGFDLKLIPYELSETAPEVRCAGKKTIFLIGGEGGFTGSEVEEAKAAGFREMSFGRTILRAETAGVFAVAMVRTQLLGEEHREWF